MIISFFISYQTELGHWFARSGSLVVLFGAFLEYNSLSTQQKLNEKIGSTIGYWQDNPIQYKVPESRNILNKIVLTTLVIGTLIWGYGDLLF